MKIKLLVLCMLFSLGMKAQIVNIPDANFKARLLYANGIAKDLNGNSILVDANGDGEIQQIEAQQVSSLDVSYQSIHSMEGILSFSNLKYLLCHENPFTSLNVQGLTNLRFLYCYGSNLTLLNVQGCNALQYLDCHSNLLTSLNLQDCISLQKLYCNDNQLTLLNVQNCTALQDLNCTSNQLTSLNVQGFTALQYLNCGSNQLTSLNVQGCVGLKTLYCTWNQLASLNVQGCAALQGLHCSNNQIGALNTLGCIALQAIYCDNNQLISLDVEGLTNLYNLSCHDNQLTSLNLQSLTNLEGLDCRSNQLTALNVEGLTNLTSLSCQQNQLTTLNLQGLTALQYLNCFSNQLTSLFLKNSVYESVEFGNNPNLQYICTDEGELMNIQLLVSEYGYTNCNVNSYCSFVPGGNYNTITGTVRFDENNNGCDTNDEFFEHMKLKINDGTNTGETFVNNNGEYDFYTQAGSFTVTAEPENPALFNVTPATFSTSFPDNNNNIFTQNICVTKNGTADDLEVVIAPITNARPGFDATYKLMWRNKGNTTLSGNVYFTFDISKMSFISSVLPSSISGNQISFNFSGLKPYENAASEITFNINPPTHPTNPVNDGDILNFSAEVNPASGDINPQDNAFNFKQTVVNSFDPNDIVCMEGNFIPTSMIGKYLHYIVNFENTGTAPATNIVVEMDIDPNDFDISTLQLQNSSHQVYTRINGNKVEFIMKNAHLGNGGHGNVLMKMATKNNLSGGDNISNKANIYFDYNFPIVTNNAETNIESTLQTSQATQDNTIKLYPIPTKGEITIDAASKITSVEVYDAQGRILQKHTGINSKSTKITIRSSSSGVYYFKVNTEKGTLVKKVLKN